MSVVPEIVVCEGNGNSSDSLAKVVWAYVIAGETSHVSECAHGCYKVDTCLTLGAHC